MSVHCDHSHPQQVPRNPGFDLGRYRVILWIALLVNAGMFGVEVLAGLMASLALQGGWSVWGGRRAASRPSAEELLLSDPSDPGG